MNDSVQDSEGRTPMSDCIVQEHVKPTLPTSAREGGHCFLHDSGKQTTHTLN